MACHIFCEILDFKETELLRRERLRLREEGRSFEQKRVRWEKEWRVWRRERRLLERQNLRKKIDKNGDKCAARKV